MSSVPFFLAFFAIVIAFAMLRGGGPERVTAAALVIALAGTVLVGLKPAGAFRAVPIALLIVDVLLLAALCVIAVRANRWWPIPVAGCQLVAVLVHGGKLLQPDMIPNSYVFLIDIWAWPMTMLLGLGTFAHRRRLAEAIIVPDWKTSSERRQLPIQPQP